MKKSWSMRMNMAMVFLLPFLTVYQLKGQMDYKHSVPRVEQPVVMDANWQKPVWKDIEAVTLKNYMGEKPEHFPEANVKLTYDNQNLYLIWQVKDQYVRAVARNHQDPVYQDSCVEFFFCTEDRVDNGYFNLEMNCGGIMLFKQRDGMDQPFVNISEEDLKRIKVAHSLPERVTEEITNKITWYLEYTIPFEVLNKYNSLEIPQSGTIWRANFYKIADKTSHPHWITWSEVDHPTPNFHLPEFFGSLIFE